jgi:integrase
MYSDPTTSKASKGSVQVIVSNGRLQLRFRFGGKRHYLSLGVSDTPINRKLAEAKARQIELDILSDNFDQSLTKYKPRSAFTTATPELAPKNAPTRLLKDLWERYTDYKSQNASPKTINGTYEPVAAHLRKCLTDGLENTLKFRMELLQITTQSQARRTLMQLSAACQWGMKHGLVSSNPFEGMYKELEPTKPSPPISFTVEERDRIIQAFEHHSGKGINYRHYAPFVKFLFWTGCRPCEAIGLRWGSVTEDCSRIHFHESIVEVSGKKVRRNEDKTGVKRWFSCTPKLQELLQSIKPENPHPQTLVFPSPKGGAIGETNFSDRAWKTILTNLELATKNDIKMTPYNCRDTFITLQAMQGNSSTTIARWVGNSSKVIEEKYLDRLRLEHLRPTERLFRLEYA